MELKQYTPEQPMGQRKKSQEKLENTLGQIKIKKQHTKIYRMWQKLRGDFVAVNTSLKKKRNLTSKQTLRLKGQEKEEVNPKLAKGRK